MISTDKFMELDKDQLMQARDNRIALRTMYCSENGAVELMNLIRGSRALDMLDSKDAEQVGAHNLVVSLLEAMGLLDEDYLLTMIRGLMDAPLMPAEATHKMDERETEPMDL